MEIWYFLGSKPNLKKKETKTPTAIGNSVHHLKKKQKYRVPYEKKQHNPNWQGGRTKSMLCFAVLWMLCNALDALECSGCSASSGMLWNALECSGMPALECPKAIARLAGLIVRPTCKGDMLGWAL